MRKTAALVLAMSLGSIAFGLGQSAGQLPQPLHQANPDEDNLRQWRQDWTKAGDSIVEAVVVGNSPDRLYVYVDYIYSGSHGERVTTCGSVLRDGQGGPWSCAPVSVAQGRGFLTLRLGLASNARNVECSDEIRVGFYDQTGTTFFETSVPFEKTWIKDAPDMYGKIREVVSMCPAS